MRGGLSRGWRLDYDIDAECWTLGKRPMLESQMLEVEGHGNVWIRVRFAAFTNHAGKRVTLFLLPLSCGDDAVIQLLPGTRARTLDRKPIRRTASPATTHEHVVCSPREDERLS